MACIVIGGNPESYVAVPLDVVEDEESVAIAFLLPLTENAFTRRDGISDEFIVIPAAQY